MLASVAGGLGPSDISLLSSIRGTFGYGDR